MRTSASRRADATVSYFPRRRLAKLSENHFARDSKPALALAPRCLAPGGVVHAGELLDQCIFAGGNFRYCTLLRRLGPGRGAGGERTNDRHSAQDEAAREPRHGDQTRIFRFGGGRLQTWAIVLISKIDLFEGLGYLQIDGIDLYRVHRDDESQPVRGIAVIGCGRDNRG